MTRPAVGVQVPLFERVPREPACALCRDVRKIAHAFTLPSGSRGARLAPCPRCCPSDVTPIPGDPDGSAL